MTVSLAQPIGQTTHASPAYTYPTTPTPGNLLVVACGKFDNTSSPDISPNFTAPTDWLAAPGSEQIGANNVFSAIFAKIATESDAGPHQVGSQGSIADDFTWYEFEPGAGRQWPATLLSSPVAGSQASSVQSTYTTSWSPQPITYGPGDGVSVFAHSNEGAATTNHSFPGFTVNTTTNGNRNHGYQIFTGSGTINPTVSWTSGARAVMTWASFTTEEAPAAIAAPAYLNGIQISNIYSNGIAISAIHKDGSTVWSST